MTSTSERTIAAVPIDRSATPTSSHVPASVTPKQNQESDVHSILYEPCIRPSGIRGSRWSLASASPSRDESEPLRQRTVDKSVQTCTDQHEFNAQVANPIGMDVSDQSNEEVHTDAGEGSEQLCSSGEVRMSATGGEGGGGGGGGGGSGVNRSHSQDSLNTWPPRSPANRHLNCRAAVQKRKRMRSDSRHEEPTPAAAPSGGALATMPPVNWTVRRLAPNPPRSQRQTVLRIRASNLILYIVIAWLVYALFQESYMYPAFNRCPEVMNNGRGFSTLSHHLY
ncbi:hypothetical protein BOX15_Mlig032861g1 [Macrostomum lignano]|uniref:KASH domain-containing protein n=2 Tax=Macrostomum lignano TaxID=282301 RepID=A0A1I8I6S2_9PLAT|nr:hypothetical protein BOX15_Mlig032861g2 [Macrostomum lignano]PAA68144.1 hypothetical protein BOX15_Mlig032861g1 [Macrostomum lignano]